MKLTSGKITNKDTEEARILKKYPKIFAQKELPMTQSCMAWGLEIGYGWMWIIDMACGMIQNHIDFENRTENKVAQFEATQVKEKFGGLRFYNTGCDDYTEAIVDFAENLSYKVCEMCGTTQNVSQNESGWIVTLCDKCRKENR